MSADKAILNSGATESQAASSQDQPQIDFENEQLLPGNLMVQRKLSVGAVDDPLEDEADQMADKIMRMPDNNFIQRKCAHCEEEEKETVQRKPESSFVQRKCASCEEEEKTVHRKPEQSFVQRKCAHCEEEEKKEVRRKPLTSFIQKKGDEGGAVSNAFSSQLDSSRGNGSTMDNNTRGFMESRFNSDFGNVRIHNNAESASMSKDINAKAFTVGNDIYFNNGQYQPHSSEGKHLLAHELTHTIQQTGTIQRKEEARWDNPGDKCKGMKEGRWLESVIVNQEIPQHVVLNWSDGTKDTGLASSGKGQCCADTSDEVACDIKTSRMDDTNCTPITTGTPFRIEDRRLDNGGWKFWCTFVPSRAIALHAHYGVNGEPRSHGCVRLNEETAKTIFCGARQNKTKVEVHGFARPNCSSPVLQQEWLDDISYIQTDPKNDKALARGIKEVRNYMRRSYNVKTDKELDTLVAGINSTNIFSSMPRCGSKSPIPIPANSTVEESRVFSQSINVSQFELPFASNIMKFMTALTLAPDIAALQTLAAASGEDLWSTATKRAQTPVGTTPPNIDDRPLYWTRLRMIEEIRSFTPKAALTAADRQKLIDIFDKSSRGETTINFGGAAAGQKKILISGFDPFGLSGPPSTSGTNMTILDQNPSGAAVLALDGQSISGVNGLSAFMQGVIFPVRYRDFDAGAIESLFRPFLDGSNPVSMIMTISQGRSTFEVEQWAGRNRSTDTFADNEGALSGGSPTNPIAPPGIAGGPEFLPTQLPHKSMSSVPQTSLNTQGAKSIGGKAVSGTGGGFLSNEIFYRVRLLQTNIGGKMKDIPVGHLHVPSEDTAGMNINTIKDRIREIIAAALPALP